MVHLGTRNQHDQIQIIYLILSILYLQISFDLVPDFCK